MSRRVTGRGARSRSADASAGIVARAVDHAFENPAMSGGLLVMALTFAAIVSNTLFLQTGHHPEPLFDTRPASFPGEPGLVVPMPRPRADYMTAVPPTPSAAPRTNAVDGDTESVLAAEIQRELARLGLYTGPIDGIAGPHTAAAIKVYETAAGIAATGTPSAALLDLMRSPPPPAVLPDGAAPLAGRETANDLPGGRQPAGVEVGRHVQNALNRIGYGPIAVDGYLGAQTANAIRRFELDNGLPITGEIDDRVIQRLVAIGAMKPI